MRSLAVIVTHNRETLLQRAVFHLKNQTINLDEILVVNNGSTDNTPKILEKLNVSYITQENVGSAGGWHAGIKYALKNNFDYCWLMDDDGFPASNAFELLQLNFPKGFSCLSSIVVREDQTDKLVFPMPRLNAYGHPVLRIGKRKIYRVCDLGAQSIYPFAHLFNGALISMEAVREVGNINTGYFIMGDEVDYFYRLRSYGPVGTLVKSKHFHPDVTKRPYSKVKIYYLLKNTIINHQKYMNLPFLRNLALIPTVLLRTFLRNGFFFLFLFLFNKDFIFFRALQKGFKGNAKRDM